MSHWNHRVLKSKIPDCGEMIDWYTIREVYYNEDGSIMAHTADEHGVSPCGNTLEELRETLERMLRCLDNPILEEGKIEFKDDFADDELSDDELLEDEIIPVNRDEL